MHDNEEQDDGTPKIRAQAARLSRSLSTTILQIAFLSIIAFFLVSTIANDSFSIFSCISNKALAADISPAQPWGAQQSAAILMARQGEPVAALAILEPLQHEHPEDLALARDLIVVCTWAERDADAIRLYVTLPTGPQPDNVLEAVALAYRHLDHPAEALLLYRQGLRQSPNNAQFSAGEIRSLVDLGQVAPAITLAEADLQRRGERIAVLLAAGFAASAQKKPVEALRYIDRAMRLDPMDREARRDRILAIDAMGAPQVAEQLANENPGILTSAERRHIDSDAAAALVRWGSFEPPNEEQRFAASDRAIATLDSLILRWSQQSDESQKDVLRARFDRMVAYRDRVRMRDVLSEYEDLRRQDVAIPGYALVAAADAYLYFRQPETARGLYLLCLETDPRNPDTRLALFYAYVELDDFDAAFAQVDAAAADQAIWLYLKGLNEPIENPERSTADLAAANARLFADELGEANKRVSVMAEAAPNNTRYRSALANIFSSRGWPHRAAEEYDISRALKPRDVTTEVGQARNNLLLRDYSAVETQLADLNRRFPENLEVQRLNRLWQVHNMSEFRLTVEQDLRSSSNVQGGSGIAIDAQLYSKPFDDNWRIFAGEYVAHELLPEGEGTITLRRSAAGAEYRGIGLVASLEGTMNAYGPQVGTTLTDGIDRGRGGARALATWSANDHWDIGGGAELFAQDTPLRALRHDITANSVTNQVVYRESESRKVQLNSEAMNFSDGNLRTNLTGQYDERLITQPHLSVESIVGLAESQNSADSNRPYFNPRQDSLGTVGLSISQTLYRRYELVYDHHLVVTPGVYWEQGFGTGGAATVLYEHQIRSNDVIEAGLGVSFSRQPYDGTYQNTIALLFNARSRF